MMMLEARGPATSFPADMASPARLDALTGLRFFAAFAVLLFHVPFVLPASVGYSVLPAGALGVNFFFVLSGFILAHAYSGIASGPGSRLCENVKRLDAAGSPVC